MLEHPDFRTLARRSPAHRGGGGSCAAFDALVEPYVDDDLAPTDRRRLEAHLPTCAPCRHEVRRARQVASTLRALPEVPCPPLVLPGSDAPTLGERLAAWWSRTVTAHPGRLATAAALLVAGLAAGLYLRPASTPAADVARAEAEVKLALAYLGRIGERTGDIVAQDVLEARVAVPIARTVRDALGTPAAEARR